MNELKKGQVLALHGSVADEYVSRALRHVAGWKLTLPNTPPLVLDFGLGEFEKIGEIEFWIANETDAGYCGKFLFLFDGQTCPLHLHKIKLETFFLLKGKLNLTFDEREITLEQGDVQRIDRGAIHQFSAEGPSLLLEISMPSIIDDNYFSDTRIPIGGNFREARG